VSRTGGIRRRSGSDVALLLFGIAVFVFLFLPIAYIVAFSFNTGRILQVWEGFGFAPYERLTTNDTLRRTMWVSIRAGIGAAAIASVLGSLAGVALAVGGPLFSIVGVLLANVVQSLGALLIVVGTAWLAWAAGRGRARVPALLGESLGAALCLALLRALTVSCHSAPVYARAGRTTAISGSPCGACACRTSGSTCGTRSGPDGSASTSRSDSCAACSPRMRGSRRFERLREPWLLRKGRRVRPAA